MKKSSTRILIVLFAAAVAFASCNGREAASKDGGTETIAPAQPQPASSGTDEAMTQTVDIEDSRSEADGGALTDTAHPPAATNNTAAGMPVPPTTTATGTAAKTTTATTTTRTTTR
ncbi:MAG TPA: hypothetical protein VF824_17710 [Thermoanaerobaculia bacterium]